MFTVNATSDMVTTGRDQLLCRLQDQLGCRATAMRVNWLDNYRSLELP